MQLGVQRKWKGARMVGVGAGVGAVPGRCTLRVGSLNPGMLMMGRRREGMAMLWQAMGRRRWRKRCMTQRILTMNPLPIITQEAGHVAADTMITTSSKSSKVGGRGQHQQEEGQHQ
jgi:hypothetical protein